MPPEDSEPITGEMRLPLPPPRVTVASVDGTFDPLGEAGREAPPAPAEPEKRGSSPLRVIARGFTWVTASQVITAAGNVVLTPFVIHGLGIQRYGLFVLTGTITTFLGSLNGGLTATAQRYFPVYAGADDRVATTRLLVTFLGLVLGIGLVLSIVDWYLSPYVVRALSMSPSLRPESLFLFRTLGALFTFSFAHQLVQSVMVARQRFDRAIQAAFFCYCLWVVGLVVVVHYHYGLRGVAIVFVAQQIGAIALTAPTSMGYLTRKGLHLLTWPEFRQVFSFSAKLQVTGLAGLINYQVDTLLVGTVLSVRTVGIYNSGNSFASQLSSVLANVIAPANVHLGNTYGKEGAEATFRRFSRMQRSWAQGVTGWTAVGAASAYFAITAWLGPQFKLGGWVAVICLGGAMFALGAAMMSTFVTVMRKAGLEMRYGLVQMAVNLVFTIPLVTVGALGVAAGAAFAQVVGAVYLVRAVKRQVRPDMPNFLRQMPVLRGLAAGAVTLALQLVVRPHVTTGPLGLLECLPPAAVGMAVFGILVVGPRRSRDLLVAAVRQRGIPRQMLGQRPAPAEGP